MKKGLGWQIDEETEENDTVQFCPADGTALWTDDPYREIFSCGNCRATWELVDGALVQYSHYERGD